VKASCTTPVTISELAMSQVTDTWNWVMRMGGTTTAADRKPISSMPTMDSTHGPEPITPA
jgi:hypothetical protein